MFFAWHKIKFAVYVIFLSTMIALKYNGFEPSWWMVIVPAVLLTLGSLATLLFDIILELKAEKQFGLSVEEEEVSLDEIFKNDKNKKD